MVAFALYFAPCHCVHCAHWNALSVPHTRVRPSTQIHFAYFSYLFPSKKLANNSLNYTDVKIHNDCGCGRNCVCSFADAGGRRTAQGWWVHTIRPSVTNFNFDQIPLLTLIVTFLPSFSLSLSLNPRPSNSAASWRICRVRQRINPVRCSGLACRSSHGRGQVSDIALRIAYSFVI